MTRSIQERVKLAALLAFAGWIPMVIGVIQRSLYVLWGAPFVLLSLYCLLRSRRSETFARLALVLVSLSTTLVVLDMVLRHLPFVQEHVYYRPHDMYNYHPPSHPELVRYRSNVHFEGAVFGDLAAISGEREAREWRDIVFRTDDLGFRNEPGANSRKNDVILLGDSFGMGMDTTQDSVWSSVLEREYGLRVYNLSIPGNAWSELTNLKLLRPDIGMTEEGVVLWALFSGNDLEDKYLDPWNSKEAGLFEQLNIRFRTFRRRSVIRQVLKRVERYLISGSPDQRAIRESLNGKMLLFYPFYVDRSHWPLEEVKQHRNYGNLEEVFRAMKAFSQEDGLRVAVAVIPTKPEVYSWVLDGSEPWSSAQAPSGFAEAIRDLCERNDFNFLDMKPDLISEAKRVYEESGELLWWRDDTHWNDAGHAAAARIVFESLLRSLIPSTPSRAQ